MASLTYQFRVLSRDEQEQLAESIEHAIAWGVGDAAVLELQLCELVALILSRKRLPSEERERLLARWGKYAKPAHLFS